jgi:U3 small nucleolar RNA-associated protein MPP10
MLAPEELFTPNASDLQNASELLPAQKRALRHKRRRATKGIRDNLNKKVAKIKGTKELEKQDAKSTVKIGKGVTVVGKKAKADPKSRLV